MMSSNNIFRQTGKWGEAWPPWGGTGTGPAKSEDGKTFSKLRELYWFCREKII